MGRYICLGHKTDLSLEFYVYYQKRNGIEIRHSHPPSGLENDVYSVVETIVLSSLDKILEY